MSIASAKPRRPTDSTVAESPFDWRRGIGWLRSADGRAALLSFATHAVVLCALSLAVVGGRQQEGGSGLIMSPGVPGSDGSGFDEIVSEGLESSGGSPEFQIAAPPAGAMAPGVGLAESAVRPEVDVESAFAGLSALGLEGDFPSDLLTEIDAAGGGGRGRGKGSGMGNLTDGFAKPGGGRVVRKGKFSAWTVPADPQPFQNYLIVIEVAWPKSKDKKLLRSRRTDLTGTVEGSDEYFQQIEKTGQFIPKSNQMVIAVPGAQQYVRDVIRVRSKILNESQELTITF